MEALLAIAALCAISAGGPFVSMEKADRYQLKCQQDYISCYEKKLALEVPESQDVKVWQGKLKSCVTEKKIK